MSGVVLYSIFVDRLKDIQGLVEKDSRVIVASTVGSTWDGLPLDGMKTCPGSQTCPDCSADLADGLSRRPSRTTLTERKVIVNKGLHRSWNQYPVLAHALPAGAVSKTLKFAGGASLLNKAASWATAGGLPQKATRLTSATPGFSPLVGSNLKLVVKGKRSVAQIGGVWRANRTERAERRACERDGRDALFCLNAPGPYEIWSHDIIYA
ncbi:hypothetical protein EVAR_58168_1 [Eumeta japonica]|uniref:Uncharacterized protein n=1 Tax=Eumeta variegata TaxID=151549 RepID=A0A4C1X2Y7_EUMVA|nr:hypothetical protein EVAR_58168_1 [Eumeta japonica]